MALFRPEELGRFLSRANPDQQVLCGDGIYRPGGSGSGTVTSVDLTAPSEITVGGVPITTAGTITLAWTSQAQNLFFASPDGSSGIPSFRAIVPADLPGGTGTVTSVDFVAPPEFAVSGNPITTAGTITLSWTAEAANKVLAGPTSGPNATPSFRSLVAADIPSLAYVTSVDVSSVSGLLSSTGGPITTSGTITLALISQTQHFVFAAPSGSSGIPSFRALVAGDLPAGTGTVTSVDVSGISSFITTSGGPITTSGTIALALTTQTANFVFAGPTSGVPATPSFRAIVAADLGTGTANSTKYLRGDLTWQTTPAGSVTSVDVSGISSFITSTGGPITTSGTITLALSNQSANLVFAGPTSGLATTPTFRAIVAADLGTGTANNTKFLRGDLTWQTFTSGTVTSVDVSGISGIITTSGGPVTTSGTIALALATQSANTFFAGPTTGAAADPTFRTVVAEDLATGTPTSNLVCTSAGAGTKPTWAAPPAVLGTLIDGEYSTSTALDMNSVANSFDVPGAIGTNHTGITGDQSTDVVTDTGHGYANGTRVIFSAITGGAGLAINIQYYVITATTNTYQLSLSVGGAAVNFTTNITAGTIRSVASLQISIPGGTATTKWCIFFSGLVAISGSSTARDLGIALVTAANNPAAPGNSGLVWPVGYASNAAGPYYAGQTADIATAAIPLQPFAPMFGVTLTAGTTYKIVVSARNAFGVNTWTNRGLVASPLN